MVVVVVAMMAVAQLRLLGVIEEVITYEDAQASEKVHTRDSA